MMIQTQDLRISRLNFARVRFENFSEMFFCFYEEDNRLSDKEFVIFSFGCNNSSMRPNNISSEKRPVVGKIV